MLRNRLPRPLAAAALAVALSSTALGSAAGASTSLPVASSPASPAPEMSLTCTMVAIKFNVGKAMATKEGASTLDQINGQNLSNQALDSWYRLGCDIYGRMPIW